MWFSCGFTFTYSTIILCHCDVGSASKLRAVVPAGCVSRPVGCCSFQLELFLFSVVKLQRWWKFHLLHKLMTKFAIIIQSHTRGWMARRKAIVHRHHIIVIQVLYFFNRYHLIIISYALVLSHFVWLAGRLSLLYWFVLCLSESLAVASSWQLFLKPVTFHPG